MACQQEETDNKILKIIEDQKELLMYFETHYPKIYQEGLRATIYRNRMNGDRL